MSKIIRIGEITEKKKLKTNKIAKIRENNFYNGKIEFYDDKSIPKIKQLKVLDDKDIKNMVITQSIDTKSSISSIPKTNSNQKEVNIP